MISPVVLPASICREIGHRARVRDASNKTPHIELEPERSFVGPLSGQSVYEQTSGVLRHTGTGLEACAGAKVARPPARPHGDITSQFHSVPGGQSVRMTKSGRSGQSQTHEALERRQLKVSARVPRSRRCPNHCSSGRWTSRHACFDVLIHLFPHSVRSSLCALGNMQIRGLSEISSQVELVRSIRGLCGLLRTRVDRQCQSRMD